MVAVDLPSGLPADTGRPLGPVVEAAATVTFFRRKPGHLLYPGRALCGRVTVADIGIPAARPRRRSPRAPSRTPPRSGAALYRPPAPEAHKYRRGHAVVVSGGMARTGAARLAAGAALRAGAGPRHPRHAGPDALAVNAAHLTAVMLARAEAPEDSPPSSATAALAAVGPRPGLGTGAGRARPRRGGARRPRRPRSSTPTRSPSAAADPAPRLRRHRRPVRRR